MLPTPGCHQNASLLRQECSQKLHQFECSYSREAKYQKTRNSVFMRNIRRELNNVPLDAYCVENHKCQTSFRIVLSTFHSQRVIFPSLLVLLHDMTRRRISFFSNVHGAKAKHDEATRSLPELQPQHPYIRMLCVLHGTY
jgi:hypothetical protein